MTDAFPAVALLERRQLDFYRSVFGSDLDTIDYKAENRRLQGMIGDMRREMEGLRGELHVAKSALDILTQPAETPPTVGDHLGRALRFDPLPGAYGR